MDRADEADAHYELALAVLEDEEVKVYARASAKLHEGLYPWQTWRMRWADNAWRMYCLYRNAMHERARGECNLALELSRELGDLAREARIHCLLAAISSDQQADEQAREEYQRALELYRELGDQVGDTSTRQGLAEVERVIQRTRELRPAAAVQVAKRRTSDLVRALVPPSALLTAALTAIWALTGMDSPWPFYLLFAVGAGFTMVVVRGSSAPVRIGLLTFAFGAVLMIAAWALTDVGTALLVQALLVFGWFCGRGAITGRRRVACPWEGDVAEVRSVARAAALAEGVSGGERITMQGIAHERVRARLTQARGRG